MAENSFTGGAVWGARALLYCEGEAPNRGFLWLRLTITAVKTRLPSSMLLARLRGNDGVMRHRGAKRASSGADACTAVPPSGDVGKHLMGEPVAA